MNLFEQKYAKVRTVVQTSHENQQGQKICDAIQTNTYHVSKKILNVATDLCKIKNITCAIESISCESIFASTSVIAISICTGGIFMTAIINIAVNDI